MRFYILLFIYMIGFSTVYGTTDSEQIKKTDANLNGHVIDKKTGEHVPFLTVMLKGTNIGTATDESGHYYLKNLPLGTYAIRVSGIGYHSIEQTITLSKGKTIELNFEIEEDMVQLETVVVSANKNETSRHEAPVVVNVITPKLFENTNSVCLAQG